MLEELKRCNYIGNKDGILFIVGLIAGKEVVSVREISNCCAFRPDLQINCSGALAFLEYIGVIKKAKGMVCLTSVGGELIFIPSSDQINFLSRCCIDQLFQDGLFDNNAFEFDESTGRMLIRKYIFSLSMAAIRNYLIANRVIENNARGDYEIGINFEEPFVRYVQSYKKAKSLEQLLKQQKKQQEQGLLAEEFVLKYEKKRLSKHPFVEKVKRISDFDVAAGYDIVSFCSDSDLSYNRFIEVKSYQGAKHFYWSENELDVAKLKSEDYFLCLVDTERILDENYEPEFIQSPAKKIFTDDGWMISPASYRVTRTR